VAVVTNRYGNQRLGANTSETVLTVANVGGGKFGLLFAQPVDGHVLAQPLYLPGLLIAGVKHNVTFVATEHDTVYAFERRRPGSRPLDDVARYGDGRHRQHQRVARHAVLARRDGLLRGHVPKSGITSTPVIDPATGRMYVVAKTLENGTYFHRLHALDVLTGKDVPVAPYHSGVGAGHGHLVGGRKRVIRSCPRAESAWFFAHGGPGVHRLRESM